ncbi:MAG: hypothetical protein JXB46_02785, partial [Candidatus Eisenbacteria bacterium]|nr:hypothetical protein [Candidatus Eisenbacteria bacterium]
QVKEEILTRFGELGVVVEGGTLAFDPVLLRPAEFLSESRDFRFYDVAGEERVMEIGAGSLVFTFCQVPIVYERTDGETRVRVMMSDGEVVEHQGNRLDEGTSREIFDRTGRVALVQVGVPTGVLCRA